MGKMICFEEEIQIVVQGGCVIDVLNLPDNFDWQIIDLDIQEITGENDDGKPVVVLRNQE